MASTNNTNLCKELKQIDKKSDRVWKILSDIDKSITEFNSDSDFADCFSTLKEVADMGVPTSDYANTILNNFFFNHSNTNREDQKDEKKISNCYSLTDKGRKCGQILSSNKGECADSCTKDDDLCRSWFRYLIDNVPSAAIVSTIPSSHPFEREIHTVELTNGHILFDSVWIGERADFFIEEGDEKVKEKMISSACRILKSGKAKTMTIVFDVYFPDEFIQHTISAERFNPLQLSNFLRQLYISFPESKFIDGSYFVTEKNWKLGGRNSVKLIGTLNF